MKTARPASPPAGTEYPRWSETLGDRRQVVIRPLSPDDHAAERAFIEGLSPRSRRYRFLGNVARPTEGLIRQLLDLDYRHQMAFAAVTQDHGARIVGVSRYNTDASGLNCECAVVVADDWQGIGLGTLLMQHLIEVARSNGIQTMTSIDLAENAQMRALAGDLGFCVRTDPDDRHQVIYELMLSPGKTS